MLSKMFKKQFSFPHNDAWLAHFLHDFITRASQILQDKNVKHLYILAHKALNYTTTEALLRELIFTFVKQVSLVHADNPRVSWNFIVH